jgi:hypothetical protein
MQADFRARTMSPFSKFLVALACLVTLASQPNLHADGCFVLPPFVWQKFNDINEPNQKAILLYDTGREDMILQVRYEGPVTQFGWLIPVPSRPEIAVATMAGFYELSRLTQEYVYRERHRAHYAGATTDHFPLVQVIEYRTVGAYDVAVLETESTDSLAAWLRDNHFAFRQGSPAILGDYLEKHWFIIALRVHLEQSGGHLRPADPAGFSSEPPSKSNPSQALRTGELHPIKISFDTPDCIFPLKVSAANGRASELLLYVLSSEPLTCAGLVGTVHYPAPSGPGLDLPTELDSLFPAGAVAGDRLPKCTLDLPRLAHKKWAFAKFLRVFRPQQMEDLTFHSMFPLLRTNLDSGNLNYAYCARARLAEFQELAMPLAPDLARSRNAENRVACCGMLSAYPRQGSPDILLRLLDDHDFNVRLQACYAAGFYNDPQVILRLLALLNDHEEAMSRAAALSCGKLGVRDPRVIEALIELLNHPYPTPRDQAQAALIRITGRKFQTSREGREWWSKNQADFDIH